METYFAEIGEIYLICIDNIIEFIQPARYLSSANIRGTTRGFTKSKNDCLTSFVECSFSSRVVHVTERSGDPTAPIYSDLLLQCLSVLGRRVRRCAGSVTRIRTLSDILLLIIDDKLLRTW